MKNTIEIEKEDLKKILLLLMNKLDASNHNTFVLDQDLYWNVLDEELYHTYKDPKDLTMGSLTDDWRFLQNVLNGKREMIDDDLYKLSSILRFLGKQ